MVQCLEQDRATRHENERPCGAKIILAIRSLTCALRNSLCFTREVGGDGGGVRIGKKQPALGVDPFPSSPTQVRIHVHQPLPLVNWFPMNPHSHIGLVSCPTPRNTHSGPKRPVAPTLRNFSSRPFACAFAIAHSVCSTQRSEAERRRRPQKQTSQVSP